MNWLLLLWSLLGLLGWAWMNHVINSRFPPEVPDSVVRWFILPVATVCGLGMLAVAALIALVFGQKGNRLGLSFR
jgi:hypothetical protein